LAAQTEFHVGLEAPQLFLELTVLMLQLFEPPVEPPVLFFELVEAQAEISGTALHRLLLLLLPAEPLLCLRRRTGAGDKHGRDKGAGEEGGLHRSNLKASQCGLSR
jgi:hypothetical protein